MIKKIQVMIAEMLSRLKQKVLSLVGGRSVSVPSPTGGLGSKRQLKTTKTTKPTRYYADTSLSDVIRFGNEDNYITSPFVGSKKKRKNKSRKSARQEISTNKKIKRC